MGGSTGTSFTDTTAPSETSSAYTVIAYDVSQNASPASMASGSVSARDETNPGPPPGLTATVSGTSVTLNWLPAGDDKAVSQYKIVRGPGSPVVVSGSTYTYTDSTVTAGGSYTYTVTALDAAAQESLPATVSIVVPIANTALDSSPNQYIPPEWQTDFYDNLTAVLRQKMAAIPGVTLVPPAAAHWFDTADDRIAGSVPTSQTQIQGHEGSWSYLDVSGSRTFVMGDPIWNNSDNNNTFNSTDDFYLASGTTYIHYPAGTTGTAAPSIGTVGRTDGLNSGSILGGGTVIWHDKTTFAQDFAAFYSGLADVIPDYGPTTYDTNNPYTARYSVGDVLPSADTATFTDVSISIGSGGTTGTTTVTVTAGDPTQKLVTGDNVQTRSA